MPMLSVPMTFNAILIILLSEAEHHDLDEGVKSSENLSVFTSLKAREYS